MKNVFQKVMVVIACLTLLLSTTLPTFAASVGNNEVLLNCSDEEEAGVWVDFTDDDPNIKYSDYLRELAMQKPMLMNTAVGELYFFNNAAAEIGAAAGVGAAAFGTGALILGGLFVGSYAVVTSAQELVEDAPEFWASCCALYTMALDTKFVDELTGITKAILNGQKFFVSQALIDALAEAINGIEGAMTDSAGNVLDTTIIVAEDELRVGTSWAPTFTAASANRAWVKIPSTSYYGDAANTWVTASNDWITRSVFLGSEAGSPKGCKQKITNTLTAATLITNAVGGASWHNSMSRFYYCNDTSDGSFFWIFGTAHNTLSSQTTYCAKQGLDWFTFENTATVLDGKEFVSCVWDTATSMWHYTDINDNVTIFPLDPVGLILTNTGKNTTGTGTIFPGNTGTVTGNPAKPGDGTFVAPPIVANPAGDGTIVSPITNTLDITQAKDIASDIAREIKLDDPVALKDFIAGFGDDITGLWDWLPVDFTNVIDGVIATLVAFLVVLVGVKVIKVLWGVAAGGGVG